MIRNRRRSKSPEEVRALIKRRYAAERRFRACGVAAIGISALSLCIILISIFTSGYSAFSRTVVELDVNFDPEILGVDDPRDPEALRGANYYTVLKKSVYALVPEVTSRKDKKLLSKLISSEASEELADHLVANPLSLGTVQTIAVTASSDLDQIHKGNAPRDIAEALRRVNDKQLAWYDLWVADGRVRKIFNWKFFSTGDSRSAEFAGIGGATLGSLFTLIICLVASFPVAVAAAVYLEEFAPNNRLTELIEVNINNLAAVPSIIYGLLGLEILLNVFGFPRGTPLVGGVVLSLMTLPVIIIACRASLKAVPPSIRQGAMAMGASPVQVVLHHVLPLALPGTLTGTIIGLARALGETAPLLMIGMVAFIVDVPKGPLDPSAVLPVQIYLWAESAERGFVEKTSAAIMVILLFLICMNATAVYLRQKFQRRW